MRYDRYIFKLYAIINVLILTQFTQKWLTLRVRRIGLITSVKSVNIRTCFQNIVIFCWSLKIFFFFFELRNYEMFHSANGIKREIQSFSTVVLSRYLPFRYHNILLSSSWYWTADGFSLFSFKTHYILCIYFLHKPNPFSAMFRVTLKEYGCPSSSLLSGQNRGKRIKEVQANISIVDIGTDKTTK